MPAAAIQGEEGPIATLPTAIEPAGSAAPNGAAARAVALPGFVTPEWLRENHHLMKADRRRLASALAEEYAGWPADGSDEAAFWRAVHGYAGRWSWFLWLFEARILKTFGRVKATKKQLAPRLVNAVWDRALVLRPLAPGEPEPHLLDALETLWHAGEHGSVAQAVWVLSCLEGPDSRSMVSYWLSEPEIDALVGDAVRRARLAERPERADLEERLRGETAGAHLEKLVERADAVCRELDKEIAEGWAGLRKHVAGSAEYRPAADELSYLLFELEIRADEHDGIAEARDGARARCRHAGLRALLEGAVDAMPETMAEDTPAVGERIGALLEEGAPLGFPDPEWRDCRDLAERLRVAIVEPDEHELALREASRRYAETPSAANRDALQAAAAAERENPRSIEPALTALDGIAACLAGLAERFGSAAGKDAAEVPAPEPLPRDPGRAHAAEIAEARAAVRDAEARVVELERSLGEAAGERDALRGERHRLLERIAALEGSDGGPAPGLPPLGSYAELPAWADAHLAGRVALAGRALRSLKGARFDNVALVGEAVALLGTAYWRMKSEGGRELREAFEGALRALRLQETSSGSRDRQAKARDDFTVEWEGKRLTLDRHLKNNAGTRDPRRCLRIYFAWDGDAQRVVIGHLPGHMKTLDT